MLDHSTDAPGDGREEARSQPRDSREPVSRDILTLGKGEERGGGEPAGRSATEARKPAEAPPDTDAKPAKEQDAAEKDGGEEEDEEGGGWRETLRRHPWAIGITAIIFIVAIVAAVLWYLHARNYESTDDAFIDGRPVSISPEVTGNIVAVPVTDNQVVKAGDLLARIDDRDYVAAVSQAQAAIEQAEASVENYAAQVQAQQASVEQANQQVEEAQAALNFSQDENKRYQELVRTGFGTVQRAQQAASDLQSKQAALRAAQSAQVSAERQVKVLKAQRRTAEAQLDSAKAQKAQADANLTRTELHATMDGRVTRLTAAVGQVATQSQGLMVLVPLDLWVTANFKETQLAGIRIGQPVEIEVDAYGRSFPGHVDSIQAGSGTAFSLLPAENATGNYVKVVQRVPTKIVFDSRPDVELGPGMSVVPTVTVRGGPDSEEKKALPTLDSEPRDVPAQNRGAEQPDVRQGEKRQADQPVPEGK